MHCKTVKVEQLFVWDTGKYAIPGHELVKILLLLLLLQDDWPNARDPVHLIRKCKRIGMAKRKNYSADVPE